MFYIFCFQNILKTLAGNPIIPHWKHCNPNIYKKHYNAPFIVCPGNNADNLLSNITKSDIEKIRNTVILSINYLKAGNYSFIFNKKRLHKFF